MNENKFICPVCKKKKSLISALKTSGNSLICENLHCFDKAGEGYYNFDLSAHGVSSGDSKEMCGARRSFLSSRHYEKFAHSLYESISKYANGEKEITLCDAGCGEGFYLREIKESLEKEQKICRFYGADLAKNAVKLAAKSEKNKENGISYCVASIFELPLADNTMDFVTSVFAPVGNAEAARILKRGGFLIVAGAGKRHLFELKKAIYETPYENEEKIGEYEEFSLCESKNVSYEITLSNSEAKNLFLMTPYFWKTSEADAKKLDSIDFLTVTADFFIHIYKKI